MGESAVAKREFHAFLSHAHVDKEKVDNLYHFLFDVFFRPSQHGQGSSHKGVNDGPALIDSADIGQQLTGRVECLD